GRPGAARAPGGHAGGRAAARGGPGPRPGLRDRADLPGELPRRPARHRLGLLVLPRHEARLLHARPRGEPPGARRGPALLPARYRRPAASPLAPVAPLPAPVEVLLSYPPANDTKEQMLPYFREIAAASGGRLSVRELDQPAVPALAKERSIRDNGYAVLKQG